MGSSKSMRQLFGEELVEAGAVTGNLVVLDSDVSSSTQTKLFGTAYPDRFFNCGIAEGNMVGIAAGMAASGLIPIAASFAFLISLRAGDDVRSLVCYNKLNVKLVGGYCGLSDYADGASHQSITDIAIMRAMPGMCVMTPSDTTTTRSAIRTMLQYQGPVYLRLSRDNVEQLYQTDHAFKIGKANVYERGKDLTLVTCGTMLKTALQARQELAGLGISAEVLDYTTIKPFDEETLLKSAEKTGAVITLEEHNIIGGLGDAVAECLGERCPTPLRRLGICDCFGESGTYDQLLEKYGLTSKKIVEATKTFYGLRKK